MNITLTPKQLKDLIALSTIAMDLLSTRDSKEASKLLQHYTLTYIEVCRLLEELESKEEPPKPNW